MFLLHREHNNKLDFIQEQISSEKRNTDKIITIAMQCNGFKNSWID